MNNPTIDEMKSELLKAGWIEKRATIWQSPWLAYYRGPAGAYRIMKTEQVTRPDPKDPTAYASPDAKPGDTWGPYRLDKDGWWCLMPSLDTALNQKLRSEP
jgi:hypothetical protein